MRNPVEVSLTTEEPDKIPAGGHLGSGIFGRVYSDQSRLMGEIQGHKTFSPFYSFDIQHSGGRVERLAIKSPIKKTSRDLKERFSSWDFLSDVEALAYSVGNLLDFISLTGMPEVLRIHASAIQFGEHSLIFSGESDVGKTTMHLNLMLDERFKFLSDDMVIARSGKVWPSFGPIRAYPHHFRNNELLRTHYLTGSTSTDKAHFLRRLLSLGQTGVRRTFRPDELFTDQRIGAPSTPHTLYFLQRTDEIGPGSITMAGRPLKDIIHLMRVNTFQDFQLYFRELGWNQPSSNQGFLSATDNQQSVFETKLGEFLGGAECFVVNIGRGVKPDALVDFLKPKILATIDKK